MGDLYVSKLCELLHTLKITQDAIAAHLQVARSTVGSWSGGKRPLPKRHVQAFGGLVEAALRQAEERPWVGYGVLEQGLLATSNARLGFETTLLQILREWELELYDRSGALTADIDSDIHLLTLLGKVPSEQWGPGEYERARDAAADLNKALRAYVYLKSRIAHSEGYWTLGPPPETSPTAYFQRLWSQTVGGQWEGETEGDEPD